MADPREQTLKMLKEAGAVLTRQKTHEIWRLPDGRTFVRSKTPSSPLTHDNEFAMLKRILGVKTEKPAKQEGHTRSRKARKQRVVTPAVLMKGRRPSMEDLDPILEKLMKVVRTTKPRYAECFPMERRVVYQTPVTTWLRRIFGGCE